MDGTVLGTSPCTLKTEKQLNTPSLGFVDIAAFGKIGASKGSVLEEEIVLVEKELGVAFDSVRPAMGFADVIAELLLGSELPTFGP